MFQKRLHLLTSLMMIFCISNAQWDQGSKFDLAIGYGVAGSFFVRSYDESVIYPEDVKSYRKNFIGSNTSFDAGLHFKKGYALRLGFNRQHFSKQIFYDGFLDQWEFQLDRKIYHIDKIFSISLEKRVELYKAPKQLSRHLLIPGMGVYYIRSNQNEIDIRYSIKVYTDVERNYKNSKLEEAGIFISAGYEYTIQPKVSIGINSRFNFTVSTGEPESFSITPYVRFLL